MAERASEHRIPLSELIRSFRTFHYSIASSSLIPALRLTRSLADEICKVKEETGRSPTPRFDWIDSIVVYSQSNRSEEIGYAFDTILKDDDDDDIRVEILPALFDNTENEEGQMNGMLYSLGIVFYEIFSRGERPAELEQIQIVETTNGCETGAEELFDEEDFNPFLQGETIHRDGDISMYQTMLSDYNLSDDDIRSSHDMAFQGDGPRKRRIQNENYNMCSISVEPLKESGVPRSLCDLIANMLDCANGTLRKDETYQDMSEVRDDLQLLLDKPSIYLHDQDMERLSTIGLQIGETLFGRNAELSTIKKAYRRSVSGDSELVTIYGHSGTGKSLLAFEFGKYLLSDGGILLTGKFDQRQQGKPFSALASAFNQYCGILLQNCELAPSKQKLAHQINHLLGSDAHHLAKLIPNLTRMLGLKLNYIVHNEGCNNAQKRLQYLLCRFVEVISSTFAAPVTLCLDDLQWADSASIAAVNQLLLADGLASPNAKFFFLGCYRDGETDNRDSLWKTLCNNDLVSARSTDVKLDCMDEETLTTMVSETLYLLPRLTRSLSSIIYHKTKGNPLFVSRLMISLSKEGLLRPSLSMRRWEWDEEKIQCQKLPDDVAMFFTKSIEALSEDVKASLCVLSCFGSSTKTAFMKTLERLLHKNLLNNLDIAVEEGLLDKKDGRYHFSHDRIQEAAYNMMNFLDQGRFHFSYGMALASLVAGEGDDSILLTAANQLNLAGPEAVQEKKQNVIVANLNLQAGKKAMEMSDFVLAYSYFDNGISFLRKKHWDEHYKLSLELFDLAARCALTNGDIVSLELISEQVIAYGRSYEDKLNVLYLFTCALGCSSRLSDSIEKSIEILRKLGIDLQEWRSTEACVQETITLLSTRTDEEILNTRQMTEPKMIIALKFLGKLEFGMTQTKPRSVPFVTQKIIELSLAKGMSPMSPIGFVYFGSFISKRGDISCGYRYVKLALSLLDKVGKESAGEVISIATQVKIFVEPIQAALEYHNDGYAASMVAGDVFNALLNILFKNSCVHVAGVKLQTMREEYEKFFRLAKENNHSIFLVQIKQVQRDVFRLIGSDEEVTIPEEETLVASNNSVLKTFHFRKAYISFVFRSYDDAKEHVSKFYDCLEHAWANLMLSHISHALYIGLISYWVARKSRDTKYWIARGNEFKLTLKRWTESCQWTFENKWYLLEAEESFSHNDYEVAKLFYKQAISSAKLHKFVHEEALAYELAAYFHLELGEMEQSMEYFLAAHERYHEWGAFGKCNSLFEFVNSSFSPASINIKSESTLPSIASDGIVNANNNTNLMDENTAWMNFISSVRSTQNYQ